MNLSSADIQSLHDQALARWSGGAPLPPDQRPTLGAEPDGGRLGLRPDVPVSADGDAPEALLPKASLRPTPPEPSLRDLVEAAHLANFTIWGLEDEARRRDVGDARIVAVKRAIDPWNQRRNDLTEAVDAVVLATFANVDVSEAELHSETAGMMIDRLSILALKIRNMDRVATDAVAQKDDALAAECSAKARVLRGQRDDLAGCLDRLLSDFAGGRRYFKCYLQLKAYNDERLNAALRAAAQEERPR